MKPRRKNNGRDVADEDDTVTLPELDGEDTDTQRVDDDFGEHELMPAAKGPAASDLDLEEGVDDPPELDLDTGLASEALPMDTDEAGELVDGDLGLALFREGRVANTPGDGEAEGLDEELGEGLGVSDELGDSPGPTGAGEPMGGLDDDHEADSWLQPLPPLDTSQESDEGFELDADGTGWLAPADMPLPADTNLETVEVAPGVSWPLLPGVDVQRFARPAGHDEMGLHAVCGTASVIYLGGLYRSSLRGLVPLPAAGLAERPLGMAASVGSQPRLWMFFPDGLQCSLDGGGSFDIRVALPFRGGYRGAALADGTLWLVHGGELCRVQLGVGQQFNYVACDEPPVNVVSDGLRGLLLVSATGRLWLSEDAGQNFRPLATPGGVPLDTQLCSRTALVTAAHGLWLSTAAGLQQLFARAAHGSTIARSVHGLYVFACVHSPTGWLLVRIPVRGEPPCVVFALPPDAGAPRFVSVHGAGESPCILVGTDHAFLQVQVPVEQE